VRHKGIVLAIVLLTGLVLVYFTMTRTPQGPVAVHSQAPDFEVADIASGQKVRSANLRGRVVFVNFWASWCQPCKEEMASIDSLFKEESPKGDFVMLTILYKDGPESALGHMKANGFNFPVYTDPQQNAAVAFKVTGVPETYVIDKKGILRKKVIGPADWSAPEARSFVDSLLKE
jgi:cytochrome c biogenesis protein CcmG/thiol:disulfide interchange protein DsbE